MIRQAFILENELQKGAAGETEDIRKSIQVTAS
jgi:hypothetical protein